MIRRYYKMYEYLGTHIDGVVKYYSTEEILHEYGPYYISRMREVNKENLISNEDCVNCWIAVNWAIEITKEEYDESKSSKEIETKE